MITESWPKYLSFFFNSIGVFGTDTLCIPRYVTLHFSFPVTFLFFSMCGYGYEMVNWGLLSLVPIYILVRLIYIMWFQNEEDNT